MNRAFLFWPAVTVSFAKFSRGGGGGGRMEVFCQLAGARLKGHKKKKTYAVVNVKEKHWPGIRRVVIVFAAGHLFS